MKWLFTFFDRLEDKIRSRLSHYPITYALVGGVSIVIFWRAVWHLTDFIPYLNTLEGTLVTLAVSVFVLLVSGLFVSFFIGDRIILSGLHNDKKVIEKVRQAIKEAEQIEGEVHEEVEAEAGEVADVIKSLTKIEHRLASMEKKLNGKK